MRRHLILLAALFMVGVTASFAQGKPSLNIKCNEAGAEVFINGRLAGKTGPDFTFQLPPGEVQIRIQKNGFKTYETVVRSEKKPIFLDIRLERAGRQAPGGAAPGGSGPAPDGSGKSPAPKP